MATVLLVFTACGGSVRDDAPSPAEASVDAGEPWAGDDGSSSEADPGSQDFAREAGDDPSLQEHADAAPERVNPYVPVGPQVPYDADALPGGSFEGEGRLGHGFDLCLTRTPGVVDAYASEPAASEGTAFVRFRSGPCAEGKVCSRPEGSAAQLFLWSPAERSHDTARGLYFDMVNLGTTPTEPTGTLSFYSVDSGCEGTVPAIVVPLADLALDGSWRTRCVPLEAPVERLGVAITGSAYDVGFDAVRFGGPCR